MKKVEQISTLIAGLIAYRLSLIARWEPGLIGIPQELRRSSATLSPDFNETLPICCYENSIPNAKGPTSFLALSGEIR